MKSYIPIFIPDKNYTLTQATFFTVKEKCKFHINVKAKNGTAMAKIPS